MKKLRTVDSLPEPDRFEWLRRVKKGESWTFTFYALQPFICYVHWFSGRTISCTEPLKECRGHQLGAPQKILSYIHGYNLNSRREEFLELPHVCAFQFLTALGEDQLRGCRATFTRMNGDTSKLRFELLARHEKVSPSVKLPPPESPEKKLRKAWGLNESLLKIHKPTDLPEEGVA